MTFGLVSMGKEVTDLVTGISGAVSDLVTGPGYDAVEVLVDELLEVKKDRWEPVLA